LWQPSKLSLD